MNILVIAPHPDDEVLGCGGIIAKRVAQGHRVCVCIVTEGKPPMYSKKYVQHEEKEIKNAHKNLGIEETIMLKFPSAHLDKIARHKINDALIDIVKLFEPDEVFIPHIGDIHKDHQIVAESSMVALRPRSTQSIKRILSYEVLSETDWNIPNSINAFIPNIYEDISEYIDKKIESILMYKSQLHKYPEARSIEGINALAVHRGVTVGVNKAEAFMLIREVAR
jgi:N-acetylglucosaminylphosphatidylinositol deacetylase family protein|nr:MAG TPA: LMBE-RELATED PROTEIN, DEACETYLASE, ROSSMANN FOLD, ZINC-DEPENDENT.8A [Caudoviricetes sp.]